MSEHPVPEAHGDPPREDEHMAVAAYALGLLDDAEATRFEEHLAICAQCPAELEGLLGVAPLLADVKNSPEHADTLLVCPRPQVLDSLLGTVTESRRRSRTRQKWAAAVAAALIVAGPVVGVTVTEASQPSPLTAQQIYEKGEKYSAVDPVTKVAASVSMQQRPWGTHVLLRLSHVQGPLTCELVAVGTKGERQTVTTWSVPPGGYGPSGGYQATQGQLLVHGGAGLHRDQISRFEVRTLDGKHLVTIRL